MHVAIWQASIVVVFPYITWIRVEWSVSHGLVTMWRLTKIPNAIWYPGTGTQVQCCVAIVIPIVFDILDPYPYPYPWYPYPWSRTRTHTHIYGLVPIPVPVPMTSSHVVPVPIPVPMVSYPYPYPYPWSRTRTRTHTHGLVPIPVPVPMIRTHTTSLQCIGFLIWMPYKALWQGQVYYKCKKLKFMCPFYFGFSQNHDVWFF